MRPDPMSAGIREHRDDIGAGVIASVAFHVAVVVAAILLAPAVEDRVVVNSVPVTIVADAVPTAPEIAPGPPAEAALEPIEELVPPVEAAPPPPVPKPTPTPSVKPKPTVTPKPRPTPPKPSPSLNLDALADDPTLTARKRTPRPAPTKADAPVARPGGAQVRGTLSPAGIRDAMAAIEQQIIPNWTLNCTASDLDSVKPVIRFRLNGQGVLVGDPQQVSGVVNAETRRALAAVKASDPFSNVPEELVGKPLQIRFDAAKACRAR